MKSTILTVIFALASLLCAFYSLVYPAWFQQRYMRDGKDVFQSFGLFAYYSTSDLSAPFYASKTMLQYSDFCNSNRVPNYMLGDGQQFRKVLCGNAMQGVQATTITGAVLAVAGLAAAVLAVFNPSAGWAEKIVSGTTLVSSLLLAVSLVLWGWMIQQKLYNVDSINSAFNTCKSDETQWKCWFYGYSFWVCLASVILMSITGYASSAGRAEKIRYFRKEYERDMAVAVQASMAPEANRATSGFVLQQTNNPNHNNANNSLPQRVPPSRRPQTSPAGHPQDLERSTVAANLHNGYPPANRTLEAPHANGPVATGGYRSTTAPSGGYRPLGGSARPNNNYRATAHDSNYDQGYQQMPQPQPNQSVTTRNRFAPVPAPAPARAPAPAPAPSNPSYPRRTEAPSSHSSRYGPRRTNYNSAQRPNSVVFYSQTSIDSSPAPRFREQHVEL